VATFCVRLLNIFWYFFGFRVQGFLWLRLLYMNSKNFAVTEISKRCQIIISCQRYIFYISVILLLIPYRYYLSCPNSHVMNTTLCSFSIIKEEIQQFSLFVMRILIHEHLAGFYHGSFVRGAIELSISNF
jgi:hypothetical protein